MTKIHISFLPETIHIIEKWVGADTGKEAFVFPFITEAISVQRRKEVIKQVIKNTNCHMNKIAEEFKLDVTYTIKPGIHLLPLY